eukprot:XP_001709030.1 Hypothetical protein GL50803_22816 [Giardia lamblia ATCC 50803]
MVQEGRHNKRKANGTEIKQPDDYKVYDPRTVDPICGLA